MSRNARLALFASAIICLQIAIAETARAAVPDATTKAWSKACNQIEEVEQKTGRIQNAEISRGLTILSNSDQAAALSHLDTQEACLSIIASETAQRPTIVLSKTINEDADIHPRMKKTNPAQAKTISLAYRLDDLDLDIYDDSVLQSEQFQEWSRADPDMAKGIVNNGMAQMAQTESRSFTILGNDVTTCVVVLEPTHVLESFLKRATPKLQDTLTTSDRNWLSSYGPSVEFWHEVSHCQAPATLAEKADRESIEVFSEDAGGQDSSSCSALESSTELKDNLTETQEMLKSASEQGKILSNSSAFNPGKTVEGDKALGRLVDSRLLVELSMEALMDRLAMNITAERMDLPETGCTNSRYATHPWEKLRALWSVGEPDVRYMTWLTPWLKGQPHEIKRQILADAWAGLLATKKEIAGKAFYRDWMLSQMAQQRRSGILNTPALTPDTERKERWESWLTDQVSDPGKIKQALSVN